MGHVDGNGDLFVQLFTVCRPLVFLVHLEHGIDGVSIQFAHRLDRRGHARFALAVFLLDFVLARGAVRQFQVIRVVLLRGQLKRVFRRFAAGLAQITADLPRFPDDAQAAADIQFSQPFAVVAHRALHIKRGCSRHAEAD